VHAVGNGDLHNVAGGVLFQRLAHGGVQGDVTLEGVGIVGAHDGVGLLLAAGLVKDGDGGADVDNVLTQLFLGNDLGVGQDVLQLLNAALQTGLLVSCCVVLGVFGKVAKGLGFLDLLGDLVAADADQVVQLFLQLLDAFGSKALDVFVCHDDIPPGYWSFNHK